ncbi:DUF2490 domain-containing protein, partial [Barnesiella intestinihominis]
IGTLWNFTVSKQINRINLQIQQNVWTLGKYYERYMPIAVVSYTAVPKYLKLNALYYYMNQQTAPNIYKNRHRYQLGATFSYPVHRFSLSLNSRFESTYTIGTAKPSNKWRNKILLSYTIPDSRWTPFIHTDIFLFLNGKQSGELDRIWYDAGVEYRIDKKNSIECKVREEHLMSKTPQQLNTFISLGYKLKL